MFRLLHLALLAAPLALVACAGPSYVNVPGQAGDLAVNNANSDTVREVTAAAVKGMLLSKEVAAPIALQLPEGATALTHADVARRVGPDVVSPNEEGVEAASRMTIHEIRVRGTRAQVDVVAPGPGGLDQLTTVYLGWTTSSGWQADRMHSWRAGTHTVALPPLMAPVESP